MMKSNRFSWRSVQTVQSHLFSELFTDPWLPLSNSQRTLTVLLARLQTLDNGNKETIIMGDLNVDYLKKDHSEIKDCFKANGKHQL